MPPSPAIRHPSRAALRAARAAHRRRTFICGCWIQLCRNPHYSGLVDHWELFHADAMPLLVRSQANWLERVVERASETHEWPYDD